MYTKQQQLEYSLKDNITKDEEELMDGLAEIFSIVVTIDKLEKLYLKDCIDDDVYTDQAMKMMAQYKSICTDNARVTQCYHEDLDIFVQMYSLMNCSNGVQRLKKGIPATVEHFQLKSGDGSLVPSGNLNNASDSQSGNGDTTSIGGSSQHQVHSQNTMLDGKAVAETTGNFITLMDALKLKYNTKDQLHPLMSALLLSVNKVFNSSPLLKNRISLFKERQQLVEWVIKLNHLKVGQKLSENEIKDMLFDLDQAYKGFYSLLS